MPNSKWISYLRVSTGRQGASGLGIEAQRSAVSVFLNGGQWTLLKEFVEVESGGKPDRPQLNEALRMCRLYGAKLVIAKLDRLSRDAHFLLGLEKAGVDFVAADMPNANRLTVGIMALVAEQERCMISERVKAALAAAKVRGVQLGGKRTGALSTSCRDAATGALRQRADERAAEIIPAIRTLQQNGATSLWAIAAGLNAQGIPTSRGHAKWRPAQVTRVLSRVRRRRHHP
ncbi:recombinase family protein [Bradyrhizobium sp. CW9]|uniref:recombinase family protein n=1 Tax=Bradyrhizobium sp. CW9 TaxID=2782689 RepID=UPI001FFBE117|nr:recombinase family protein [Bradyrhizobium sp. CW9]MCK1328633.1 recombinase family protein [Bradyrhizobium sp. CW9]